MFVDRLSAINIDTPDESLQFYYFPLVVTILLDTVDLRI